jgi:hypothetical protein
MLDKKVEINLGGKAHVDGSAKKKGADHGAPH